MRNQIWGGGGVVDGSKATQECWKWGMGSGTARRREERAKGQAHNVQRPCPRGIISPPAAIMAAPAATPVKIRRNYRCARGHHFKPFFA